MVVRLRCVALNEDDTTCQNEATRWVMCGIGMWAPVCDLHAEDNVAYCPMGP